MVHCYIHCLNLFIGRYKGLMVKYRRQSDIYMAMTTNGFTIAITRGYCNNFMESLTAPRNKAHNFKF
jgi:hypothetical protein